MKKLLLLGAALLGLCAVGQTARAGGDERDDRSYSYEDDRPAPRHYEGRVVERDYCPPRPPVRVFLPPPPLPFVYGRPYFHHRRHYRPYGYGYGYGYGYAPGVHIGIGF